MMKNNLFSPTKITFNMPSTKGLRSPRAGVLSPQLLSSRGSETKKLEGNHEGYSSNLVSPTYRKPVSKINEELLHEMVPIGISTRDISKERERSAVVKITKAKGISVMHETNLGKMVPIPKIAQFFANLKSQSTLIIPYKSTTNLEIELPELSNETHDSDLSNTGEFGGSESTAANTTHLQAINMSENYSPDMHRDNGGTRSLMNLSPERTINVENSECVTFQRQLSVEKGLDRPYVPTTPGIFSPKESEIMSQLLTLIPIPHVFHPT